VDKDFIFEALATYAAACTIFQFMPQVYQIWSTKNTSSISLLAFIIVAQNCFLWGVYNIYLNSTQAVITNFTVMFFIFYIVWVKFKNRKTDRKIKVVVPPEENAIVKDLLARSKISMKELLDDGRFTPTEKEHFQQLVGEPISPA
jgi:MtN3 and saliva related transmembrane protein